MSELTWRQQRARIEILECGIERLRGLLREARTVGAMQIPDWLARIDAALRSTDQPSAALTNEAALKAQDNDPAAIYLGPACEADSGSYGDGRTWAEDQPWDDCECGHKPVRYVRADIHDARAARRHMLGYWDSKS